MELWLTLCPNHEISVDRQAALESGQGIFQRASREAPMAQGRPKDSLLMAPPTVGSYGPFVL